MLLYVHRVLFKLFPRQTLEDVFDSVFTKIPSSSLSMALTSTQRLLAMNGLVLDDRTASFRRHVNSRRPWKLEDVKTSVFTKSLQKSSSNRRNGADDQIGSTPPSNPRFRTIPNWDRLIFILLYRRAALLRKDHHVPSTRRRSIKRRQAMTGPLLFAGMSERSC